MKRQINWMICILISFSSINLIYAQKTGLPDVFLKSTVITMKQETSNGFGCCDISPYIITLYGSGTITYEGIEEYIFDGKQNKQVPVKEIPVKIVKRNFLTRDQFRKLANEFYKIDYFSFKDGYSSRDNGDGTRTIIADGGLATVITSITVNRKTKSVKNVHFAPEKLIELQRKIYAVSKIADYTKRPAYWLTMFPNDNMPPSPRRDLYRKVNRLPPSSENKRRIDINKKWGFFTPCVTTKTEVEKLIGDSITKDKTNSTQNYQFKGDNLYVLYSNKNGNNQSCSEKTDIDTILNVSISQIEDLYLSELKIDLTSYKKQIIYPRGMMYYNQDEGIGILTETVEFSTKSFGEKVNNIQFFKNFNSKTNSN